MGALYLSAADFNVIKALHCEHVIYARIHSDLVNDGDASLLCTNIIHNTNSST